LVLITFDNLKTLPQGLTVFVGEFTTDLGGAVHRLTLAALPITLFYIVQSKQFISGITQGTVNRRGQ
ncbi:carbohydrate ABC transporter permease, partial [Mesorhizobium sp. M2D.F.Ca.ET.223.01.1.1]